MDRSHQCVSQKVVCFFLLFDLSSSIIIETVYGASIETALGISIEVWSLEFLFGNLEDCSFSSSSLYSVKPKTSFAYSRFFFCSCEIFHLPTIEGLIPSALQQDNLSFFVKKLILLFVFCNA